MNRLLDCKQPLVPALMMAGEHLRAAEAAPDHGTAADRANAACRLMARAEAAGHHTPAGWRERAKAAKGEGR